GRCSALIDETGALQRVRSSQWQLGRQVRGCCGRPSLRQGFFSFARRPWPLVQVIRYPPRLLVLSDRRTPRGLRWLDLAKGRLRLDPRGRTGGGGLSSPGLRPFLARAKKVPPPPSSAALRPEEGVRRRSPPARRSPSRPRWSRGSNSKGEVTWQASAPSRSPATSSRAKL